MENRIFSRPLGGTTKTTTTMNVDIENDNDGDDYLRIT